MTYTEQAIKKIKESGYNANKLSVESGKPVRSVYNFFAGLDIRVNTLLELEKAVDRLKSKEQGRSSPAQENAPQ